MLKYVHLKQFEHFFKILKEPYFLHGIFQKVLKMLKIVHLKQFEQYFIILKELYFLHGLFQKVLKNAQNSAFEAI